MAGLNGDSAPSAGAGPFSALARQQYAALVWVQIRVFVNSFRTARGGFELGARILTGFVVIFISFGPAAGLGFGGWLCVTYERRFGVALLLWVLFLVWQFFSAFVPALSGQNPDLSHLLRYPVSLGSWILLYLAYGIMAPSTFMGLIWSLSIVIGITIARPDLFLPALLTLAFFALFNILLSRTILAWVERWMAQRRTREIVTAVFLFLGLGLQVLNPAFHLHSRSVPYGFTRHKAVLLSHRVWIAQEIFPAGLAADAILQPMKRAGSGILPLGGLTLWTLAVTGLLGVRLRSESRGESFSDAPRASVTASPQLRRRPALNFSGPAAAVFEKDLRYLLRSGPLLYSLVAPLVMVFVFGGIARGGSGFGSGIRTAYALPLGLIWAFLGLTRLVNNNLGGEGEGLGFYFLSPTPIRTVILGKNALHLVIFLVEAVLISLVVTFRFGLPAPSVAAATLAWLLFAVVANFAAGNLLSVLMPYRMSMVRMRNEPGAVGNGLVGALIQVAMLGVGAAVYIPCAAFDHPWLATPLLLALAACAAFAYLRILGNIDGMIQAHRDSLTLEIAKTA
jgi:ABC-2 type transport system permease protein